VRWLLDNVQELADDIHNIESREHVRFGTIDTWLLYQLTGKPNMDMVVDNIMVPPMWADST
jgi:glycerol kinase